ncbi:neprilysin-like protein, partial [Leptotrombidium deliense]
VNPNLTAPQTFADIGGLQLIYESYKKYLSKFNDEGIIPGLSRSNDQLFFISMAQVYFQCANL